ncbi:very-long-chain 3-oxoacyl-CoA reductase-A-like [Panonychus citri]|uniref:very-long-chain 3-oxoacyl-CoA reductase-A-like n=1 Tax=Panonychus citri TaxID=50023 RepID=UPI002308123C|nr:very-long-chain 3-oxoacyl-CoA reductase-A-like [Panonychus citri]XP_053213939.1 very-long-chain 3-oxoacyl-CoA reductase-A-like [Panonychus citri]XP_053213940.1 very-long-chain 3-oxoacyl-CoA reductase-A-like [Panonychus citri]
MACYDCLGRTVWYSFLVWFLFKVIRLVYTNLLAPTFGLGVKWRPGPDSWAVVTGSTDGIGLEYGKQLANKGYNLLLISRTQSKLETVADSIKNDCPKARKVETLAFDFSSTDYTKIEEKINSLYGTIDVLVNNVGISYSYPDFFTKLESSTIDNLININIISVTKMTHLILPKMEAARRGIIINISSYAGSLPTPLLAVYSATKVYVDYLSRSLQLEYLNKGITIQSVLPAFVATTMSRMRPSITTPTPKAFVRSSLSTVGLETRTYGFWAHKLYGCITDFANCIAPSEDFMSKISMNTLEATRKRAYKKYNKKDD